MDRHKSPRRPSLVAVHTTGSIASITLGDGSRRNALGPSDWRDLAVSLRTLDDADVNVVVVRGGGGSFSSGSDMRFWSAATPHEVDADFGLMEDALRALEDVPVPTLAVVEGVAAGAGCQLALACDLRVMARSASIGMPVARLGIRVSPAFVDRLVLGLGQLHALDVLYTGRMISADEAAACGFAEVAPDDRLDAQVTATLDRLRILPRASLIATKAAARYALDERRTRSHTPGWAYTVPGVFARQVDRFLRHELTVGAG